MLTDCRKKHVVQKQGDENDEQDEFSRLTPRDEIFHQLRRQPRRVIRDHRRRSLVTTSDRETDFSDGRSGENFSRFTGRLLAADVRVVVRLKRNV